MLWEQLQMATNVICWVSINDAVRIIVATELLSTERFTQVILGNAETDRN